MVKSDRTNLLALWLWWYKSCDNICENYTSIRTDLCPRFLTLHLKYAVLPIDALTLDCNPLRSIEGGSTFCKVDEGTMKAEPATIDGNSSMGEVKGASLEWSETAKNRVCLNSSYFLTHCYCYVRRYHRAVGIFFSFCIQRLFCSPISILNRTMPRS